MGRTAGGTIGQIRGGQIGCRSSELEQTASTSPFMQTHWHAALAGLMPMVTAVTSAVITANACRFLTIVRTVLLPRWRCRDFWFVGSLTGSGLVVVAFMVRGARS